MFQLFLDIPGMDRTVVQNVQANSTVASIERFVSQLLPLSEQKSCLNEMTCCFQGKLLRSNQVLSVAGLTHGSRVEVSRPLRGGGGDGGSTITESRSSYLEMYMEKKADKVDPAQARLAKWTCCSFSGNPLEEPLVADEYGSLFNKVDLIQGLKDHKSGLPWPENLAHITRMKDLIQVQPRINRNYKATAGQQTERPGGGDALIECPILNTPLNGRSKAFLHRHTGLILTDKGTKQVPEVARDLILEAASALLGSDGRGIDREALQRIVDADGAWEEGDMLVVHPELEDAEAAQYRVDKIVARRAKKKEPAPKDKKRPRADVEFTVGGGHAKKSLLESLFHEDGGGAVVEETFLCRSVGARGMHLS